MTRQFPGGCIIKVRGNTADPRINKADLLEAIPQNLHSRDCISFVVDPTILVPIETDVYNLNTPLTHLAAFISKISSTEIKINEKTILSKIQDGFPNQISDAEDVGHGKIKAQNFQIKAKYQGGKLFSNRLFKMPNQKYEYRYFIFLAIDIIKDDANQYVKKLENQIEKHISEDVYYDRQNNSCVHPILIIFGKLAKELYKSAVPQAAAVEVMKVLLIEFRLVYAKFLSVASSTGLDDTPYKSSAIFEEIFESDNEHNALATNTDNFSYKK